MKKVLIIACIILCIAAVTALFAIYGRGDKKVATENVEQVTVEGVGTPEGKKPISGIGTLKQIQEQGKDLECQIVLERSEAEGNIEGTLFTSKGNVRGDFMVPAAELGGKVLSSMIVGGSSMYVWSKIDNKAFGFKTDITSEKSTHVDTKEPVALEAQIKYSCTDWTVVDGSVFVPPAEVSFQDVGAAIDAGMEYGTKPN